MKQKPETLQTQTEREAQNIKTPTYKELLEENKNLNQKIENLEKRMEEILNLHKQEGPLPENEEEEMDLEETEKEEKNTAVNHHPTTQKTRK